MRKFAFVILIFIPLITFGQAEKRYRSIIVDSLKALNGGRVDVKDTLLLDSLAVYNTDLSSQYTSRSLVDSAFVGAAISASGGNTIYSEDDDLAGDRIVTMGSNNLTFSGNQTILQGLDATNLNDVFLVEDNVGTDLMIIENAGDVGIGLSDPTVKLHIKANGSTSQSTESFRWENGNNSASWHITESGGVTHRGPLTMISAFNSATLSVTVGGSALGIVSSSNSNNAGRFTSANAPAIKAEAAGGGSKTSILATDAVIIGISSIDDSEPLAQLYVAAESNISGDTAFLVHDNSLDELFAITNDGKVLVERTFSTTKKDITLGVAATTFEITGNVMQMTGDGGNNTIATITGAASGQYLIMIFVDNKISITDDNGHGANTIDLSAAFTSVDDTTLTLIYDGTSWYETSRSVN